MEGADGLLDERQDLGVGLHRGSREVFGTDDDAVHGGRDLAGAAEGGDGDLLVFRGVEPVEVDDGVVGCVARGDGDVAARIAGQDGDGDGEVVVCVVCRSELGWKGDDFEVGPVSGKLGEH